MAHELTSSSLKVREKLPKKHPPQIVMNIFPRLWSEKNTCKKSSKKNMQIIIHNLLFPKWPFWLSLLLLWCWESSKKVIITSNPTRFFIRSKKRCREDEVKPSASNTFWCRLVFLKVDVKCKSCTVWSSRSTSQRASAFCWGRVTETSI